MNYVVVTFCSTEFQTRLPLSVFITLHLFIYLFVYLLCSLEYFVHVYMRADGLCGCVTCDKEYPPRVAFGILTRILEEFEAQNPGWKQGEMENIFIECIQSFFVSILSDTN